MGMLNMIPRVVPGIIEAVAAVAGLKQVISPPRSAPPREDPRVTDLAARFTALQQRIDLAERGLADTYTRVAKLEMHVRRLAVTVVILAGAFLLVLLLLLFRR